jgi:hypothetical protein
LPQNLRDEQIPTLAWTIDIEGTENDAVKAKILEKSPAKLFR